MEKVVFYIQLKVKNIQFQLERIELSINKNKIIFVILAGGLSKRFGGGFKTFAKFNNKSIFERIESNLKANKIDIVINTNFSDEKFINKNYLIIPDLEKDFKGPLAGIYASMNWLIKKHRDPFFKKSKIEGYRSRSAFKLIELDNKFKFLKNGMKLKHVV